MIGATLQPEDPLLQVIAKAHGHGTTPSTIQREPSERPGKGDGRGRNIT